VTEPELRIERRPSPVLDLFATAVHRFGSAWADLVAAALVALAAGTVPLWVAHARGAHSGAELAIAELSYSVAYMALLGWVVLRGLPTWPGRARVAATACEALIAGLVAGAMIVALQPFSVVVLPLTLFAVPAVAAGDRSVVRALPSGAWLALRTFSRTWGVWLLTLAFSAPVWISVALVVLSFSSGVTQFFITLIVATPVIWPFSALFVRALYGDLTGRLVVAPEDRSER